MASGTINLTPHAVNVVDTADNTVVYPAYKGGPARAITGDEIHAAGGNQPIAFTEEGSPIYPKPTYVGITGLPPPEAKVKAIIVSTIVADLLVAQFGHLYKGTILVPDSGPGSAVRNAGGQIVAVKGFLYFGGPPPDYTP